MKVLIGSVVAAGLFLCLAGASVAESGADEYWPRWRGPLETGEAPDSDPPIEWSEDENVRWKVPIPGEGSSSPIVWGDFVYVTSAVDTGEPAGGGDAVAPAPSSTRRGRGPRGISTENIYQYDLFKIRRADGEIVWRRTAVRDKPHEGRHPTGTWASNSAVTDGELIYAYFGSRGLFAYDLEGDKVCGPRVVISK